MGLLKNLVTVGTMTIDVMLQVYTCIRMMKPHYDTPKSAYSLSDIRYRSFLHCKMRSAEIVQILWFSNV